MADEPRVLERHRRALAAFDTVVVTTDVLVHTWDMARAVGADEHQSKMLAFFGRDPR
jgi:hypothetical protein